MTACMCARVARNPDFRPLVQKPGTLEVCGSFPIIIRPSIRNSQDTMQLYDQHLFSGGQEDISRGDVISLRLRLHQSQWYCHLFCCTMPLRDLTTHSAAVIRWLHSTHWISIAVSLCKAMVRCTNFWHTRGSPKVRCVSRGS